MEPMPHSHLCCDESSDIAPALSNLSYNKYGELVYTQCNLSNHNLSDLYMIATYSFIQRLVIDDNHLTSLSYLENLPNLVYLSAARNRLTQTVFNEIAKACAHTIEWIDVSENDINGLSGLSQLPFLVHFDASSNKINSVNNNDFNEMHVLNYINISNNEINSIAEDVFKTNVSLRELHCSHNKINSLSFTSSITDSIRLLDVSANSVTAISECVSRLTKLMELDLSFNAITQIDHLLPLASLWSLRSLYIHNNPVCADYDASYKRLNFSVSQKTLSGSRFDSVGEKIELTEEEVLHEADEIVMNAEPDKIESNCIVANGEKRHGSLECTHSGNLTHMFAALSAAPVYGAVRRVLPRDNTSLPLNKPKAISWGSSEHKTKMHLTSEQPRREQTVQSSQETMTMTMMITWLIHHIPSLTEIDGCSITPQQRARAQRYCATDSTTQKNQSAVVNSQFFTN